jgi:isoaspartyl peptidase/L-asparaginase-like protein (Ntn-hydrolase superfamily)
MWAGQTYTKMFTGPPAQVSIVALVNCASSNGQIFILLVFARVSICSVLQKTIRLVFSLKGGNMLPKFFLRNYEWINGVEAARDLLLSGAHRHDVLEMVLNNIEVDETIETVSYGAYPNLLGEMELDAAFMDGNGRTLGAIAAIKNFRHPSSVARRLMESGLHTMLCGAGAESFAREHGFTAEETISAGVRERWTELIAPSIAEQQQTNMIETVRAFKWPESYSVDNRKRDTIVMVASDGSGLSAASSTAGWAAKHPGRVGDSPVCGAGFYVDSRYGACVCTHTGEVAMRAGTARFVVAQLSAGKLLHEAVSLAVADLAGLEGGHLGGLVIHAVDSAGEVRVVGVNVHPPVKYWYWHEKLESPRCIAAEVISLPRE